MEEKELEIEGIGCENCRGTAMHVGIAMKEKILVIECANCRIELLRGYVTDLILQGKA